MGTDKAERLAAGRTYAEWFGLLDAWGAPGRAFREISAWLRDEHGLSQWWAQKLIVEYEQARGLRPAGARPDGTLTVGTSKTVNVPLERLYEAVVDPRQRQGWLPDEDLSERTTRPGKTARFDRGDGTRVSFTFEAKGDDKAIVAVEHERLADPETAERAKASWQESLDALKAKLES